MNSSDILQGPNTGWIEKLIYFAFPVVGVLAFCGLVLLGSYSLAMLSVYLAVPMTAAPVVYLLYRKRWLRHDRFPEWSFKLMLILFVFNFMVSVLMLYALEVRHLMYFLIIVVMACIILVEIMMYPESREKTMAIIAQVVALTINLTWGVSLKYFSFIGRTDPLAHSQYVENLLSTGYVSAALGDYEHFPLWHILCASVRLMTGRDISIDHLIFIVCGLFFAILPVLAYLISMKLTDNVKVSLTAALLMSFYPYFQILGTQSLARSITSGLFMLLLYLLLSKDRRLRILIIPVTISILIYHPVAIAFIVAILVMAFVLKFIIRSKEISFISAGYIGFSVLMTVVYWLLFGGGQLDKIIFNLAGPETQGVLTQSVYTVPASELFNYLQYGLLIFFLIAGALIVLGSRQYGRDLKIFAVIAIILIPLSYPGPMFLINRLCEDMNLERFYENGIIFMNLIAAIGLCGIFYRSKAAGKTVFIMAFAILVLLSVTNDFVASDNPLVEREFYTFYFTEGEVTGFNSVSAMAPGNVMLDYPAGRFIVFSPFSEKARLIEADVINHTLIRGNPEDILVIRDKELDSRDLKIYTVEGSGYIDNPDWDPMRYYGRDTIFSGESLDRYSRIYDNGDVSAYI